VKLGALTIFVDRFGIVTHLACTLCRCVREKAQPHSDAAGGDTHDLVQSVSGNAPEDGVA